MFLVIQVSGLPRNLLWGLGVWSLVGFSIFTYFLQFLEKKMKKEAAVLVSSRILKIEKKAFSDQKIQSPSIDLKKVRILARELEEQSRREHSLGKELDKLKGLQHYQEREYATLNEELQNKLDKKETILSEYRSTLKEQRKIIEKKQEDTNILQVRLNDLKYEVENLLKLKGGDPEKKEFFEAPKKEEEVVSETLEPSCGLADTIQGKLDRYVKMAVKLNGAHDFANKNYKYSELSLGSLIIDQRRLFDRLQNEDQDTVLVYSREEKSLVFINQQVKCLLGWSPERFLKDFSFFIQKGSIQWTEALEDVKLDHQKSIRLLMKTRSGRDVLTHCYLKEVPSGIFRGYVLGILSAATAHS